MLARSARPGKPPEPLRPRRLQHRAPLLRGPEPRRPPRAATWPGCCLTCGNPPVYLPNTKLYGHACVRASKRELPTTSGLLIPLTATRIYSNPSCPLQALNGEGQQEADDLQLK